MLRLTHPDQVPDEIRERGTIVTIGTFDGMHKGHQALLARLVEQARELDLASVVLTFHPHPLEVLHPERAPEAVCSLEQRLEHLERAGVDVAVAQAFTHELAAQTPREFVEETYVRHFAMRRIVVGRDSRFGRKNAGTVDTLAELGAEFGFTVDVVDDVGDSETTRWSSTAIRTALSEGRIEAAGEHLGRHHAVRGTVVHGERRGRELGFPTANLSADAEGMVPADGVYAGWLVRDRLPLDDPERRQPAAISVGSNPTFDAHRRTVEAYVLDRTDLDLYGEPVSIEFVQRLRGMVRYEGVEPLIAQMTADVAAAREVLS